MRLYQQKFKVKITKKKSLQKTKNYVNINNVPSQQEDDDKIKQKNLKNFKKSIDLYIGIMLKYFSV